MVPERATEPSAGVPSPASTFINVVFPAPLAPTRPTLSPDCSDRETSEINRRAPASMARSRTRITDRD